MTYQSITATPISPKIGAEIGNIDLTRPLSELEIKELHDAFIRYQVIFFRDQRISFEDQIRVAGYFGPLGKHVGVNTISKQTDNELVRKFHYDETSTRISGENFHSDQSCADIPPLGSMLYNHTVPPDGGGDSGFFVTVACQPAFGWVSTDVNGVAAGKVICSPVVAAKQWRSTNAWCASIPTGRPATSSCSP